MIRLTVMAISAALLVLSLAAIPLAANAQLTVPLTVGTQYADGAALSGMWTTLQQNGAVVATGFSPVTFNLLSGASYTVSVGDYQDTTFHHWDNGSETRARQISISSSTTVTAHYVSNAHPLPPTDPSPPSGESVLTVNTQYADGATTGNMWTVLRSGGTIVGTGFSPVSFTLNSGASYTVSVGDYQDTTFHHWDNGSTTRLRPISITTATTVTAHYVSDAHPLPPTDDPEPTPPPSGTAQLTVNTRYANDNPLSGMYTTLRQGGATGTIVATGFSPATFTLDAGTQYTVTTSDYQQNTFYQWDNGSTTRARSVTISSDTTVTALYQSPTNPPPSSSEPTVQPVSATVTENSKTGVAITLQGSGSGLTYYPVTQPAKGALSLVDGNIIRYTPYDWHDGPDSFQYAAHDGIQSSAPATVSINITDTGTKTTSRLVVITVFEDGRSHTGASTTLSQGSVTINSGFSHIHYAVNNGQNYIVTMGSGNNVFVRWQDTGSIDPSRQVNISQDTAIIAVYRPS
jgi:hypothetical protein